VQIDIAELESGSTIVTQVCIIGAGPAGITLARRLDAAGVRTVLLESGGAEYEAPVQALNAGVNEGLPYYELVDARLRFFGGTAAIWGGRSAALDPIDLRRRPWVPHSGWPIEMDELAAWYAPARAVLELPGPRPGRPVPEQLGLDAPAFDERRLCYGLWQFDTPPGRFALARCGDLVRSTRVAIITHATAVHLQAEASGGALRHVEVASLGGQRLRIRARRFVLAAGGLENARLLLAADDVQPQGLGNARDLVGRFFMEHPHGRGGRVVTAQPWKLLRWFAVRHSLAGRPAAACVRPGERWQERHGGLNSALTLACRPRPDGRLPGPMALYRKAKLRLQPTRGNRRLWQAVKAGGRALQAAVDPLRPWLQVASGRRAIYAVLRAEQAPNPASRVYLGGQRDALGQRVLHLDWRLSELDRHGARVAVQALDAELARLGLGRVELAPWLQAPGGGWEFDPLVSTHPIGGFHHLGTTRMAAAPARGVVDADCRVFGVDNLYVAGSSVFPTAGWANPTLTLLALALRLGDHVAAGLDERAAGAEAPFERATA